MCLRPRRAPSSGKTVAPIVPDGSDCIDFGIDRHLRPASTRLRHPLRVLCACGFMCGYIDTGNPDHDIDHGDPSHDSSTSAPLHSLGSLDIGTRATTSLEHHQPLLQSKHPRRYTVYDTPTATAGRCQSTGLLRHSSLTVRDVPVVHDATATTAGEC